jgi:hypothetical protein
MKDEALKLAFALDYWATQTDMGRKPDPKSLIRRASAELRRLQAELDAIKQALAAPVQPVKPSLWEQYHAAQPAPVEPVACVACEGNPKWGNIPCAVCGTAPPAQPAPVQEPVATYTCEVCGVSMGMETTLSAPVTPKWSDAGNLKRLKKGDVLRVLRKGQEYYKAFKFCGSLEECDYTYDGNNPFVWMEVGMAYSDKIVYTRKDFNTGAVYADRGDVVEILQPTNYTTPPAAQPAPVQEPVAVIGSGFQLLYCREDWAKGLKIGDTLCLCTPPAAQPAPVQPVAYLFTNVQSGDIEASTNPDHKEGEREMWYREPLVRPPAAKRPWIGLTHGEYIEAEKAIWDVVSMDDTEKKANREFYRAIEAKLKQKNAAAQPAVPDAMTSADIQEHIEYVAGWNDCRQAMMKGMK